jgi:hypothetical protein
MSKDFVKPNLKYEIMTPTGWQPFSGIRKLTKPEHFTFTLSTGTKLKCSTTHPFISNGSEVLAKDLEINGVIDSIKHGTVKVISKEYITDSIDLFDIVNVDSGSLFIVDDIISHNCDFVSSGHTVVDGPLLLDYESSCLEPIERRGYDNAYWIWEYPDYSRDYIVVADVARGDGADWSTFHVIDVQEVKQVAEYKGKMPPNEFGNMLVSVATEWNNALLAIENANIGWAAIQPALDRNYENLFYTYKDDGYVDIDTQLKKGYDMKDKSQMVPGVSTTSRTRPLMISALEMYMREKTPIIRSKRLIQELLVFVWLNGKAQAQHGYNDDLVMSFCIGLWLRDTALKLRQHGIDLNKRALSQFQKSTSVIYTGNRNAKDTGWTWNTGYGDENLTWLIK